MAANQLKHSKLNKFLSLFTAVIFCLTTHFPVPVFAKPAGAKPDVKSLSENFDSIQLPKNLGEITDRFKGSQNETVILIQDAHEIPDAQRSIQKLISYFQKTYGVNQVALEGASEKLDAQIFKSFPESKRLEKVFAEYFDEGELSGGSSALVFNQSPAEYQGVEDWDLYQEGLGLYQQAAANEADILSELKNKKAELDKKKQTTYSPEFLALDKALEDFYANRLNLVQILKVLAKTQAPELGSELALLLTEASKEGSDNAELDMEVRKLALEVDKSLKSLKGIERTWLKEKVQEFNIKNQEFKTSKISAQAFALFLKELCSEFAIPIKASGALLGEMQNQKSMRDIKGTLLFESLETYIQDVKKSLIKSADQLALDAETDDLRLLERFAKLEISQYDWNKIKSTEMAPSFAAHFAFYKNAEERDGIMFQRLQERILRVSDHAILVAGGFHTEGLTSRLKEKGISYLLLMPHMDSVPVETNYRKHMRGDVSWKNYLEPKDGKIDLHEAFVRGTRDKLLSGAESSTVKLWRDQIIRDLSKQGRVENAGDYTRFMDELAAGRQKKSQNQLMRKVEAFITDLKKLETSGQLTEQNILNLLRPATTPVDFTSPAAIGQMNRAFRSELRLDKAEFPPDTFVLKPGTTLRPLREGLSRLRAEAGRLEAIVIERGEGGNIVSSEQVARVTSEAERILRQFFNSEGIIAAFRQLKAQKTNSVRSDSSATGALSASSARRFLEQYVDLRSTILALGDIESSASLFVARTELRLDKSQFPPGVFILKPTVNPGVLNQRLSLLRAREGELESQVIQKGSIGLASPESVKAVTAQAEGILTDLFDSSEIAATFRQIKTQKANEVRRDSTATGTLSASGVRNFLEQYVDLRSTILALQDIQSAAVPFSPRTELRKTEAGLVVTRFTERTLALSKLAEAARTEIEQGAEGLSYRKLYVAAIDLGIPISEGISLREFQGAAISTLVASLSEDLRISLGEEGARGLAETLQGVIGTNARVWNREMSARITSALEEAGVPYREIAFPIYNNVSRKDIEGLIQQLREPVSPSAKPVIRLASRTTGLADLIVKVDGNVRNSTGFTLLEVQAAIDLGVPGFEGGIAPSARTFRRLLVGELVDSLAEDIAFSLNIEARRALSGKLQGVLEENENAWTESMRSRVLFAIHELRALDPWVGILITNTSRQDVEKMVQVISPRAELRADEGGFREWIREAAANLNWKSQAEVEREWQRMLERLQRDPSWENAVKKVGENPILNIQPSVLGRKGGFDILSPLVDDGFGKKWEAIQAALARDPTWDAVVRDLSDEPALGESNPFGDMEFRFEEFKDLIDPAKVADVVRANAETYRPQDIPIYLELAQNVSRDDTRWKALVDAFSEILRSGLSPQELMVQEIVNLKREGLSFSDADRQLRDAAYWQRRFPSRFSADSDWRRPPFELYTRIEVELNLAETWNERTPENIEAEASRFITRSEVRSWQLPVLLSTAALALGLNVNAQTTPGELAVRGYLGQTGTELDSGAVSYEIAGIGQANPNILFNAGLQQTPAFQTLLTNTSFKQALDISVNPAESEENRLRAQSELAFRLGFASGDLSQSGALADRSVTADEFTAALGRALSNTNFYYAEFLSEAEKTGKNQQPVLDLKPEVPGLDTSLFGGIQFLKNSEVGLEAKLNAASIIFGSYGSAVQVFSNLTPIKPDLGVQAPTIRITTSPSAGNNWNFGFESDKPGIYEIESSLNADGPWAAISRTELAVSDQGVKTLQVRSTDAPQQFYRVRSVGAPSAWTQAQTNPRYAYSYQEVTDRDGKKITTLFVMDLMTGNYNPVMALDLAALYPAWVTSFDFKADVAADGYVVIETRPANDSWWMGYYQLFGYNMSNWSLQQYYGGDAFSILQGTSHGPIQIEGGKYTINPHIKTWASGAVFQMTIRMTPGQAGEVVNYALNQPGAGMTLNRSVGLLTELKWTDKTLTIYDAEKGLNQLSVAGTMELLPAGLTATNFEFPLNSMRRVSNGDKTVIQSSQAVFSDGKNEAARTAIWFSTPGSDGKHQINLEGVASQVTYEGDIATFKFDIGPNQTVVFDLSTRTMVSNTPRQELRSQRLLQNLVAASAALLFLVPLGGVFVHMNNLNRQDAAVERFQTENPNSPRNAARNLQTLKDLVGENRFQQLLEINEPFFNGLPYRYYHTQTLNLAGSNFDVRSPELAGIAQFGNLNSAIIEGALNGNNFSKLANLNLPSGFANQLQQIFTSSPTATAARPELRQSVTTSILNRIAGDNPILNQRTDEGFAKRLTVKEAVDIALRQMEGNEQFAERSVRRVMSDLLRNSSMDNALAHAQQVMGEGQSARRPELRRELIRVGETQKNINRSDVMRTIDNLVGSATKSRSDFTLDLYDSTFVYLDNDSYRRNMARIHRVLDELSSDGIFDISYRKIPAFKGMTLVVRKSGSPARSELRQAVAMPVLEMLNGRPVSADRVQAVAREVIEMGVDQFADQLRSLAEQSAYQNISPVLTLLESAVRKLRGELSFAFNFEGDVNRERLEAVLETFMGEDRIHALVPRGGVMTQLSVPGVNTVAVDMNARPSAGLPASETMPRMSDIGAETSANQSMVDIFSDPASYDQLIAGGLDESQAAVFDLVSRMTLAAFIQKNPKMKKASDIRNPEIQQAILQAFVEAAALDQNVVNAITFDENGRVTIKLNNFFAAIQTQLAAKAAAEAAA